MALKRVCDITGTDSDVEICDVTIAGQLIKLDLSPAGAQKLRDFFGPVITVRHPLADSGVDGAAPAAAVDAVNGEATEAQAEAEAELEEEESLAEAVDDGAAAAPIAQRPERPTRRGRRPASVTKSARKKAVSRRAAKPVTAASQATAEIREWARANGFEVGERGAIPGRIRSAYTLAHE